MLHAYDNALTPRSSGAYTVSQVRKQAQPDRKSLLVTAAELDPNSDPSEPKHCVLSLFSQHLFLVWAGGVFNTAGELEARFGECRRKVVFTVQSSVDVELNSKGAPS